MLIVLCACACVCAYVCDVCARGMRAFMCVRVCVCVYLSAVCVSVSCVCCLIISQ